MKKKTIQEELLNAQDNQQKAEKTSIKFSKRNAIIIAVLILLGVLGYAFKGLFIAATVNGSPISRLAIVQKLEKASGQKLLDSLITEKLIQNEANAKKIVVSDDEVNTEIKKIQDQITAQNSTLDAALAAQGMTMDDLKEQIMIQMEVEKLVADKINVTDEEIAQYITDNKVSIPEGQEAVTKDQIKSDLRDQKLNQEATALITALKAKAKISYFVKY